MRACVAYFLLFGTLAVVFLDVPIASAFSQPPNTARGGRNLESNVKTQYINVRKAPTSCNLQEVRRLPSSILLKSQTGSEDEDSGRSIGRIRRWRKRLSRFGTSALLAASLLGLRGKPAEAKFSYEIRDERKFSIRPGATQEQASQMVEGEIPDGVPETKSVFDTKAQTETEEKTPQKKSSDYDYGDEDDDEDFFDFDGSGRGSSSAKKGPGSATQNEKAVAERLRASTRSSFSGIDTSKTKTRGLYLKVSVGLFIPTWGAMGVREFVRRRKEEAYVKKGLEILEAQKAEYFNVTETTPDSDIEDELKDMKDGEDDEDSDDDEDDEDDDDDDDDDDEPDSPPPSSRKGPKRPSGGGDSGGAGGGDPGYGRPSDDDLKKLGDLFNRS